MSNPEIKLDIFVAARAGLMTTLASNFDQLVAVGIDSSDERAKALELVDMIKAQVHLLERDLDRVAMVQIPGESQVKP